MIRRACILIAAVFTVASCGPLSIPVVPSLNGGWTREELKTPTFSWSCEPANCKRSWRTPRGPLVARVSGKTYGLHDIPGWNTRSTAGRVATGIFEAVMRRNGWTTESVEIGLETRTVTDSGATTWELRCSAYWIEDREEEYNKNDDDHVARSTRRSEGAVCRAVDLGDTSIVLWRFRAGIAPSRDSLATIYDAVRDTNAALVSATPPMFLERLSPDGALAASYVVGTELGLHELGVRGFLRTVQVSRETGAPPIGVIHKLRGTTLDVAPHVTGDELRILRLLAGLVAVSFGSGG